MDSIDIARLTDVDFEALCKDLLDEVLGARFEIFAVGQDGGIDLRYVTPSGEIWIAQCKHWWRSGAATLRSKVRTEEKPKVDRLRPNRYFLLTSASLTPKVKDELVSALSPHVLNSNDIWGLREIEEGLRRHEKIVWRHLRLWLSSASVLQAAIKSGVLQRSRLLVEEIGEALDTYVANESTARAVELLNSRHVCVISGVPGVGKTTLAKVLGAAYMQDGYQLIEISADIEEALSIWAEDRAQIFYYDDFLGQTSLEEKLHKNEDSRLLKVMRAVSASPNKRLILTTRGYILAQARQRYEKLGSADITPYTCVVELSDLDEIIRGQVLYNHVYWSVLPLDQKAQFSSPEAFWPLVQHPNFNPRLIATSLSLACSSPGIAQDVPQFVLDRLEDPSRLWDPLVLHQLRRSEVRLLEVIYTLPASHPQHLLDAWMAFRITLGESSERDTFRRAASVLEGSMITIQSTERGSRISYLNPSIRDYFGSYLRRRPENFLALLRSSLAFEQLENLWRLTKEDGVPRHGGTEDFLTESTLPTFVELKPLFVSAAIDLLNTDDHTFDWEPPSDRIITTIEIAEHFESDELATELVGFLEEWAHYTATGNVAPERMAALINKLNGAGNSEVQEFAEIVAQDYLDKVTERLSNWPEIAEAQRAIDLLPYRFVDDDISDRVDSAMRAEVEDIVSRWASGDPTVRSQLTLDQVLQIAEDHVNEIRSESFDADDNYTYPDPVTALQNLASLQGDHPMASHTRGAESDSVSGPPPTLIRIFATLSGLEDV